MGPYFDFGKHHHGKFELDFGDDVVILMLDLNEINFAYEINEILGPKIVIWAYILEILRLNLVILEAIFKPISMEFK